jgi:hypothetical protein
MINSWWSKEQSCKRHLDAQTWIIQVKILWSARSYLLSRNFGADIKELLIAHRYTNPLVQSTNTIRELIAQYFSTSKNVQKWQTQIKISHLVCNQNVPKLVSKVGNDSANTHFVWTMSLQTGITKAKYCEALDYILDDWVTIVIQLLLLITVLINRWPFAQTLPE